MWSYWKGVNPYGAGTEREGAPLFEALDGMFLLEFYEFKLICTDGTGWVWNIPLHDGTMSVGVVMEQEIAMQKRKAMNSPSDVEFYLHCLKSVPMIQDLMSSAERLQGCKSASNYSYSASAYSSPYLRIVGDAGCFIDPYFSSGVHLALSSSLSAVATIQAARKGDCDEKTASQWHNDKVKEGYTVFLLIVLATMKQIRSKLEPILSDWDEDGFERAFSFYRPSKSHFEQHTLRVWGLTINAVIQGTADINFDGKLTQEELCNTVDFAMQSYNKFTPEEEAHALKLMKEVDQRISGRSMPKLTEDDERIIRTIRARKMLQCEATINLSHFAKSPVNGLVPRLEKGSVGLSVVSQNGKIDTDSIPKIQATTEDEIMMPAKEDVKVCQRALVPSIFAYPAQIYYAFIHLITIFAFEFSYFAPT